MFLNCIAITVKDFIIPKVFVTDTVPGRAWGHWKDFTTKENTPDTSTFTETVTESMVTETNTPTENLVTETNTPTEDIITEILTETNTPTEYIVTEIMSETNTPTEDIVTEIMSETNTPTEDIVTEIMTETNTPIEDIVTEIITEINTETEIIDTEIPIETNTPTEVITTLSNTETNTKAKNKLMILNRDLSNASFLEDVNVMKGHHVTTMEPLSIITSAIIQGISGIKMGIQNSSFTPILLELTALDQQSKNFLRAGPDFLADSGKSNFIKITDKSYL